MKIIDFHTHIGDIFHENRSITFKTNYKKGDYVDPFIPFEASGYNTPFFPENPVALQQLIDAGQYRVWECTMENFAHDMTENEIAYACLLPVLPNTNFEEYLAVSKLDQRFIPFTCPNFDLEIPEMEAKLLNDIKLGAKALKVHPILQNISLENEKVEAAVDLFGKAGLPVIFHVGIGQYYGPDVNYPQNPEFGDPRYFYEFAPRFKDYDLIAAHCCGWPEEFAKKTAGLDNVYTDTTFCNATLIKQGVDLLGADRVLFGTDYPFGNFKYSILEVKKALANDPESIEKVFYHNAARLLKL
ncbi:MULTISPECIES: amidohydrolase family protein [Enterococcus]|uniref:Amidohydrolase family protein n=1 Tax=Enterococcus alishanensis TaxID=1303817 RepID=A0ABS6T9J8_9ENTE|nr:amidohydrolase family protein [Enterococcus alishanensis]MBV7389565.1 amidohydrolase family protein [Enterococcus alishanensis]